MWNEICACVNCGKVARIRGRDRCSKCYWEQRRAEGQKSGMGHTEIAKVLGITRREVQEAEKRAMQKLARSPLLALLYLESLDSRRRSGNVGTLAADEIGDDKDGLFERGWQARGA